MTVNPTVSRFAAFECLETCLAECSQGKEIDGRVGGSSIAICYLSVHPWRLLACLVQHGRGEGTEKGALWPSTDKAKAEQDKFTSLRGTLRLQTINRLSHIRTKDSSYSAAFAEI